jgi:hypothetical protein
MNSRLAGKFKKISIIKIIIEFSKLNKIYNHII